MVFNPSKAQDIYIDLSSLPSALTGGTVTPYDLFTNAKADSPLTTNWTVSMKAGEYKAFGGFSLGVYAPRKGKVGQCNSDYTTKSSANTLQACFLDCARDAKCENVLVHGTVPNYMEKPAAITCSLVGEVAQPAAACTSGSDTLIHKMPTARKCANLWETPTAPAEGASSIANGPACNHLILV